MLFAPRYFQFLPDILSDPLPHQRWDRIRVVDAFDALPEPSPACLFSSLSTARKQPMKVRVCNVHSLGDEFPRLFHGMLFAVYSNIQQRLEERLEIRTDAGRCF